jgi:hypothetical protein
MRRRLTEVKFGVMSGVENKSTRLILSRVSGEKKMGL